VVETVTYDIEAFPEAPPPLPEMPPGRVASLDSGTQVRFAPLRPGRAAAPSSLMPGDHLCIWDAVGVASVLTPATDKTSALMRCRGCHSVRTELLEGIWTIAQVRGEDTSAAESL
jgi:hypothetical protein